MKLGTKLEENMEVLNSHKNELNRDLTFSQQQNRLHLSFIIQSYKTEICSSLNSRKDHTSLSLSRATKQTRTLLPTAEQTTPLFQYLKLQNRDVPFSQQQNRPHLSVIISSYTTEICPSPNNRTDHTSLSLSRAVTCKVVGPTACCSRTSVCG